MAACIALMLFAIAIRLVHINQPMRGNEAWTFMEFVLRPVSDVMSNYTIPNNHILHTLLAKFSTAVFGNAEWTIRLPVFRRHGIDGLRRLVPRMAAALVLAGANELTEPVLRQRFSRARVYEATPLTR